MSTTPYEKALQAQDHAIWKEEADEGRARGMRRAAATNRKRHARHRAMTPSFAEHLLPRLTAKDMLLLADINRRCGPDRRSALRGEYDRRQAA